MSCAFSTPGSCGRPRGVLGGGVQGLRHGAVHRDDEAPPGIGVDGVDAAVQVAADRGPQVTRRAGGPYGAADDGLAVGVSVEADPQLARVGAQDPFSGDCTTHVATDPYDLVDGTQLTRELPRLLVSAWGDVPSGAVTFRTMVRSLNSGLGCAPRPTARAAEAAIPTASTATTATAEEESRPAADDEPTRRRSRHRSRRRAPGPDECGDPRSGDEGDDQRACRRDEEARRGLREEGTPAALEEEGGHHEQRRGHGRVDGRDAERPVGAADPLSQRQLWRRPPDGVDGCDRLGNGKDRTSRQSRHRDEGHGRLAQPEEQVSSQH